MTHRSRFSALLVPFALLALIPTHPLEVVMSPAEQQLRALFATAPCAENAITLIYRAHDPADIVFRAELERIAVQRSGTVHFLIGGRDNPRNDLSPAHLTRLCPDLSRSRVFVCGPPGYAQTIRASLAALGVPRSRVRSESFRM